MGYPEFLECLGKNVRERLSPICTIQMDNEELGQRWIETVLNPTNPADYGPRDYLSFMGVPWPRYLPLMGEQFAHHLIFGQPPAPPGAQGEWFWRLSRFVDTEVRTVISRVYQAFLWPNPEELYEKLATNDEDFRTWKFPDFPFGRIRINSDEILLPSQLSECERLLDDPVDAEKWQRAHQVPALVEQIDYQLELTRAPSEEMYRQKQVPWFDCCVLPWGQPYFHMAMDHTGPWGRELYKRVTKVMGSGFFLVRYPTFQMPFDPDRCFRTEADRRMGFYFWLSTRKTRPVKVENKSKKQLKASWRYFKSRTRVCPSPGTQFWEETRDEWRTS